MLLYDQQVLSSADDDYEKLASGSIDAFSFMKKKIEQLKITPAQLARYVNTIASKGNAFSLSLVKGVADENGKYTEKQPVIENKVELPDDVWRTVNQGMVQFAQNNSILRDMEISVAGKTGTAQESKTRPDHALFVGYAPADRPEITIAVRVANGYGSSNCTTIGKSIFNYYFGLESREKIITGEASQAINTRTD